MTAFAGEITRVSPRYFVQTPNFWFPVEPHFMVPFFHWLPLRARASLIRSFSLGHWDRNLPAAAAAEAVRGIRLLSRRELRELFQTASIQTEQFAGLPKSLIAVGTPEIVDQTHRADALS
jgi:hypothetical protein